MTGEPTNSELMRRMEDLVRQIADIVAQLREDRAQNAKTYIRQDVYTANRLADQAVTADVAGDVRAMAERQEEHAKRVEKLEDKRIQARNFAITTVIALAGLGLAVLAIIANRGG